MDVTCRCGKRRYLVWSRNRSILSPLPVSSISIFRLQHTVDALFNFPFSITLSTFSVSSSRYFYTASSPHNALRCVSIRIYIDRPTVTIFIFHEVSFLSFVWCSLRSPPATVCTLFRCVFPQPLSHFLSVYFLFPDWIPILLLQYRALLLTSNCDDLDMTLSFDVVRCCNVLYRSTIL